MYCKSENLLQARAAALYLRPIIARGCLSPVWFLSLIKMASFAAQRSAAHLAGCKRQQGLLSAKHVSPAAGRVVTPLLPAGVELCVPSVAASCAR